MRRNELIRAGVVAATLLAAAPAYALSGQCLWDNLPPENKTSLLSQFKTLDAQPSITIDLDITSMPSMAKCGVTPANMERALALLVYRTAELNADNILADQYKVPPGSLEAAWNHLPVASRQRVTDYMIKVAAGNPPSTDEVSGPTRVMAEQLQLTAPTAVTQVAIFLFSRSYRSAREAE